MRRLGLIAVAAAALAVGCGDDANSASEEREVRSALRQFVLSLADRDYDKTCDLLTREVRADWERFARRHPKEFSTAGCPSFVKDFYGSAYSGSRKRLDDDIRIIERGSVRIAGDRATLTAQPKDRRKDTSDKVVLVKVNGRWLLTD